MLCGGAEEKGEMLGVGGNCSGGHGNCEGYVGSCVRVNIK